MPHAQTDGHRCPDSCLVAREVAIDSLCLLYSNERAKLRDKFIYALISINYVGFLEFLAVYGDKKTCTAAVQQRNNPRKKCTFMGGCVAQSQVRLLVDI